MSENPCGKPCRECPWRKASLPGYVGPVIPEDWVQMAHSEEKIICHLNHGRQCEGSAVYRANVCKTPRDPEIIRRAKDRNTVFASPAEFVTHHRQLGVTSAELGKP